MFLFNGIDKGFLINKFFILRTKSPKTWGEGYQIKINFKLFFMAALSSLGNYKHTGLLILRLGIGIMFIMHGLPKITGGPDTWEQVGGAMSNLGISLYPKFWGFLASIAETIGGLLMVIGFFFRPAMLVMAFTMFVAILVHLPDGVMAASQPIELAMVFLGLLFVGPGKYSVDKK